MIATVISKDFRTSGKITLQSSQHVWCQALGEGGFASAHATPGLARLVDVGQGPETWSSHV